MAKSTSTMKSFMDVLAQYKNDTTTSGIAILDHAVRAVSRFNSLQAAIDAFVDDVTDTSKYKDVNTRLEEICGIVLGTKEAIHTADTGAVSGSNAGNETTKNAVTIVPEKTEKKLSEFERPDAKSRTPHHYNADGVEHTFYIQWPTSFTQVVDRKWQDIDDYDPTKWETIDLKNQTKEQYYTKDPEKTENPSYFTADDLKASIETIARGMEHWWVEQSAQLIYDSFGVDFKGKTLVVDFVVNQPDLQAITSPANEEDYVFTPTNEIRMAISLSMYGIIDKDDVNGNTRIEHGSYECYLDRTIAHEMVHAVMFGNGTLKGYEKNKGVSMPQFFTEGVAELIMGLDDYDAGNTKAILELANDSDKLSEAMSLEGGTGKDICYSAGYMFLRYLCKQGLNNPSAVADVEETEYYYGNGEELGEDDDVRDAVIKIDVYNDGKTVDVKDKVDEGVRIDLTGANVKVSDTTTGDVIFTLSGTRISGKNFFVEGNKVTETTDPLTVWEGNITTTDYKGSFNLEADGVIDVEVEGESKTTINDVLFAVTKAPNDGVTFRKRGGIVEAELDAGKETLTVGGFTFKVDELAEKGSIAVYVDEVGSHVKGLADGDKVIVTKGDLSTTYTAAGGTLVVEYEDLTDSTSKVTKSYSRGDWNTLNTTWDGKAEPVVGVGLKSGSVTMGGKEINSVVDGALVDARGNVTTNEDKAVATIESERDSINYRSMDTSRTQEILITDTNGVNWNIDASASSGRTLVDVGVIRDNDGEFQGSRSVNEAVNFTAGSGKSEVAIYSDANSSIQGGAGNLTAAVGGKGDHHVIAGSGSKNVLEDYGSGENVLIGGSGKNTFESDNEKGTLVAGSGENIFKITKGVTNKVEGYTYGKDLISIDDEVTDYTKFKVGEGTISYDGKSRNGEVDVSFGTDTGDAYAVTILDSEGELTRVGWNGEEGGTIDASAETKTIVLIGDQNGDAQDFLMGGKSRDVIYAGEGDSVTGGEGSNEIYLSGKSIVVGFSKNGAKDEVSDFITGFDDSEADSIALMDKFETDELKLNFDGKDAVLKGGSTKMTLTSLKKNTATGAAELLIGGVKVAAVEKGTTAIITEADYADVYYGMESAMLDFKAVSEDLTLDLSDKNRFRNIDSVKGGTGNTILMGGSGKTTLVSGGGDTSLWGGAGNAKLVGARDARDEFFFFGESGKDTISGFAAGTGDTSDVLNFYGSGVTNLKGTDAGVEVSTSETSKLSIQGIKANDKLQWESGEAKGVAKVGSSSKANTFIYDDEVTNYFGGSKTDTLKVSGVSNSVWLEKIGSSIEIMDASASTGVNILAGGREAETIKGGGGNNSIWGGAGGNDVLTGGSNYNEFYFGMGEGADTITKSNDGDKVMLYNIKLEDLDLQTLGMKNGSMVIGLKDGSMLTIQNYASHGATTFQLADGTYSYDRNTDTWQEKK